MTKSDDDDRRKEVRSDVNVRVANRWRSSSYTRQLSIMFVMTERPRS